MYAVFDQPKHNTMVLSAGENDKAHECLAYGNLKDGENHFMVRFRTLHRKV